MFYVWGNKHLEAIATKKKNKNRKVKGKYITFPINGYLHVPDIKS